MRFSSINLVQQLLVFAVQMEVLLFEATEESESFYWVTSLTTNPVLGS